MRAMEGSAWSKLPDELSERVLSFLPVPALCRSRSVCKAWNALFRKPTFLDLCDLNLNRRSTEAGYLFLTCHTVECELDGWCWLDESYRRTLCFLDLAEERWYTIPADDAASPLAPLDDTVPRLLVVNDGLVCELCALRDSDTDYKVVLFDPVAKSRWELPASTYEHGGPVFSCVGDILPALVTVVDNATRSFKVFLLNSISNATMFESVTRFFVYESSTGAWRGLPNPPEPLGDSHPTFAERDLEESAVFFQGRFYTISYDRHTVLLLSYSLEENRWRQVLAFGHRVGPGYPQLHVFNNSLFMGMWDSDYAFRLPVRPDLRRPDEESSTSDDDLMYEVKEILINENSSRLLVQIPCKGLEHVFGGVHHVSDLQFALTFNSVVMISGVTGKAVAYNVKSRSFGELPGHPLQISVSEPLELEQAGSGEEQELESEEEEEEKAPPLYRAKLMNLSLRNILRNI